MKITKLIAIAIIGFYTIQIQANFEKIKGNGNVISTERTTDSYDKIASSGFFNILLVSGTEGKLTIDIEENLASYLITEVKNNELKIRWKKGTNISHRKPIKVIVPIKDIFEITQSGSGSVITSNTTVKGSDLKLSISGSGKINLQVESTNIVSYLSGSGAINLNGNTDNLDCSVSGSGYIGGYELTINKAVDAKISGSGNVKVTVNGSLNAKVSGSGNFRYKGNPTSESIKVSGSGSVIRN